MNAACTNLSGEREASKGRYQRRTVRSSEGNSAFRLCHGYIDQTRELAYGFIALVYEAACILMNIFKVSDLLVQSRNLIGEGVDLFHRLHDIQVQTAALRLEIACLCIESGSKIVRRRDHSL